MPVARLEAATDFAGWRATARRLRAAGVAPEDVAWRVGGKDLFEDSGAVQGEVNDGRGFSVPTAFIEAARRAVLHRAPDRFDLLYRLLWRLGARPGLMGDLTDPDVASLRDLVRAVDRAAHKMKAFLRFRSVADDDGREAYAAWFEPAHRVTEAVAPFFVGRFASMRFSILTPDACVHWDTAELTVTAGADRSQAPDGDALEDYWRTYYASIFNPARLNPAAMQREMPKRYWRNLPEAALIPDLIATAGALAETMVGQPPTEPQRRIVRAARRAGRDGSFEAASPISLEEVAAAVDGCRRCPLWRDATQGVAGEGPARVRLMLVGEQPGDQEDLAGRPFVGPAGQVLERALSEAGVARVDIYVTNAVKHFKHELRGKRRLHKTPAQDEVRACRWWLDAERRIVRPRVILALGATAALSVLGKAVPIGKLRGQALQLPDQAQGVVTYHPSYLLRLPDRTAKAAAYRSFVADLKLAWGLAQ